MANITASGLSEHLEQSEIDSIRDTLSLTVATAEQINAGTSSDAVVTPSELEASKYNPAPRKYESSEVPLSVGNSYTFTHNFGVKPMNVQLVLVCKVATSDFSVGDEILANPMGNSSGAAARSCSTEIQDNAIRIRLNTAREAWVYNNLEVLSYAQWNLKVRASY